MSRYYRNQRVYRQSKRAVRQKRRRTLVVALIFTFVSSYAFLALNRELPNGVVNILYAESDDSAAVDIAWPDQGFAAVGTLDEGVLASSHTDEQPRPIASLAKVITALAVLEKSPLQPGEKGITITFDAEDEQNYWDYANKLGTVTSVIAGQSMNQYQALQAMLLPSSNNMSDSLARRIFGSVEAYADYANQMVRRFGLKNTHIDDASGFSPKTVSTPSEMIAIGQRALRHPVLAKIVAQAQAEIPVAGVVPNYNRLLDVEGVTGIKPGNTDEAGWCLLFSADYTKDGEKTAVIGIVMGQSDPFTLLEESENLLNSAKQNIKRVEIMKAGDKIGRYEMPWGEKVELVAKDSIWAYSLGGARPKFSFEQTAAITPQATKQKVGVVKLDRNDQKSSDVYLDSSVTEPSLLWRLARIPF